MNEKSSLGLFLSKDKAVAVWVSSSSDSSVVRTLNITPGEDEPSVIALQAARAVSSVGDEFDELFVAVDCAYYTQYKLQSEFNDYHQVESTIKFDAEEAAATDAMNLAVAFDITGKTPVGSEVTVYTADRQLLTDMLLDMQEGALDPGFMEPDVVCLARALSHCAGLSERTDASFVVLSQSSCYMIRPGGDFAPAARSFLIGKGQDVTGILSREIMLASGATDPAGPMTSIVLMGELDNVDADLLAQRTGLDVQTAAPEKALVESLDTDGDMVPHELMIAYGAALAGRTRGHKTDFRRDFMPYQGRRKVVQSSLRLIGISLTILLVSVAVFFQLKTFRMRGYTRALNKKALIEYKAITFGKKPPRGMSVSSGLRREYKRAKQAESGIGPGGDKSVPAKLTFFFEALTKTPKKVDVRVQQITITERSMKVKGDTNSRTGTMAFFNEIKKHPRISLGSERLTAGPDRRDIFDITLEPKKSETKR
ncbi:MAG: hypothetical protein B6I25_07160 [Planctomycetales bacterium 4572_13]|nr:MAG: hypothetical protein B6I25_07160 [Planctomycetales bacterium 4572_13]